MATTAKARIGESREEVHLVAWPKDPLRVCPDLCEPICLDSDYEVTVRILGRPFATANIRGRTRAFNCRDEKAVLSAGK